MSVALVLLTSLTTPPWMWSTSACNSVSISSELVAGQTFERAIGGDLVFQIRPEKLGPNAEFDGWTVALHSKSSPEDDYIYPVNLPIRFNGLQTLGTAYGEDAKASLGHARRMRLLLQRKDYERIQPLLNAALWPYSAPHPDTAGAEYLDGLKKLSTGTAELTVLSYDLQPGSDSLRRMSFRVTFTASASFKFDAELHPKPSACTSDD
jgi:hypothetical protein